MKRFGGGPLALLVWLGFSVLPVVALPTEACAAGGPHAALVVDTGEAVHNYCVALPDEEVSGLELITLAGEQHGLTYRFGYGGGAVCMLADVGTTSDDCFERYPDFWGYWRGSEGGWTWSSTGAGNTRVGDGDVEGWSWGSGSDGSSHPRPPQTDFSSVCPVAEEPSEQAAPPKGPRERPNARQGSNSTTAAPSSAPPAVASTAEEEGRRERSRPPARTKKKEGDHPKAGGRPDRARATPTASPDAVLASDPGTPRRPETSLPALGVLALGLAGALGAAGFVIARRRRGPA